MEFDVGVAAMPETPPTVEQSPSDANLVSLGSKSLVLASITCIRPFIHILGTYPWHVSRAYLGRVSRVNLGHISQVELTRVGTRAYAPRELAAETERNSAPRTVKMLLAQAPPDYHSDDRMP